MSPSVTVWLIDVFLIAMQFYDTRVYFVVWGPNFQVQINYIYCSSEYLEHQGADVYNYYLQ